VSAETEAASTEGGIEQATRIEGPPFEGPTTRGPLALRDVSAAVVIGEQAVTTALVAIGAARGVARSRVVTIVDLIGDVPALRALAADECSDEDDLRLTIRISHGWGQRCMACSTLHEERCLR